MHMNWLAITVSSCLFAQSSSVDPLLGTWINEDTQTAGITEVTVRRDNDRTIVHVWGACHPIDCDWGEEDSMQWNGIRSVEWKGFASTHMQLIPQLDGRLLVAYRFEYHDQSGRKDSGHAEFFARENVSATDPVSATAKALLQQVAEVYRRLPAARFESEEVVIRHTAKSDVRSVKHLVTLISPPSKVRVEISGSAESEIMIADGTSLWHVYPNANEYTRVPAASGMQPSPIFEYTLLDRGRGVTRITGSEQIRGADCTVVQIDRERGVKQKLWIDNSTHFIRQETSEGPTASPNDIAVERETKFLAAASVQSIDPDFFRYDPKTTGAKNRTQLAHEAPESLKGKLAPDFALRDLNGRETRLSSLRGKAVLLDFWGTWCGSCRESMPTIELLHRSFEHKGLLVFGVDSESPEIAREYLDKFAYTLPSLIDTKEDVANLYHVQGWPTTVLIDSDGKVAFYEVGFSAEPLRNALTTIGVWQAQ